MKGFLTAFATLISLFLLTSVAAAQTARVQTDARQIYASVPFTVSFVCEGFEESPEPAVDTFAIAGAEIEFLGATPKVMQSFSMGTGRQAQVSRTVTWLLHYRVTPLAPGQYTIPAVNVRQGVAYATTATAEFEAGSVKRTDDMRLEVVLPPGAVRVGETFDIYVDWYLRKQVTGQTFQIPIFERPEWLEIEAPASTGRREQRIEFETGGGTVALPATQDKAAVDGKEYTRVRFRARATPRKSGTLQLPPATVSADLQVGQGRDRFGFQRPQTELFVAEDVARSLTVESLPTLGRPESFSNAVGTGFSIAVTADRTVVKVGDPVTLDITVRGDGELDGLILPRLDVDGGMSPDLFSLPGSPVAGSPIEDDGPPGKLFKVTVRIKNERVREVPPLAFSYFNPETDQYVTVRSDPIALSVAGASLVGAGDVVSANRRAADGGSGPADTSAAAQSLSLVGADLGLSDESETLASASSLRDVVPLLALLYLAPLVLLGFVAIRRKTATSRETKSAHRELAKAVEDAIAAARETPASEGAAAVANALRRMARAAGKSADGELESILEALDLAGFSPSSADAPLDSDLLDRAAALGRTLVRPAKSATVVSAAILLSLVLIGVPSLAHADHASEARAVYGEALAAEDRGARASAFVRAESLYAAAAAENPTSPELHVDWGNAALGANELGRAVLAYRRALDLDRHNERAEQNLEWARATLPKWVPRPTDDASYGAVFFWQQYFTGPTLAVLGAVMFALMIALLAPWGGPRGWRNARWLAAIVPALAWLWLTASVFVAPQSSSDAVVVADGRMLRSADSANASPAIPEPIPAGAEVRVIEARERWLRIELVDGRAGWIQATAIETIAR